MTSHARTVTPTHDPLPTPAEPAIRVENIVKKYGDFEAVKGVNFEVAEGEIFGLLGPNGAGKSTLIRMMTTLIPVTSGKAVVGGHDVAKDSNAVRRMIGVMVGDVLAETRRRVARLKSPEEVRMAGQAVVAFSPAVAEDLAQLRQFLHARMYRHYRLNRIRSQARRILAEMFALFLEEPGVLPTEWSTRLEGKDQNGRARVICDYIAGMTDRFAIEEHRKLFQIEIWS